MKGNDTEANGRDEQKGGQKDGMNSEPSCEIFSFMPLCGMRSSFSAVVLASYLAVHEFKVDSFQRDLQQSTFARFHVLDGKLSAQLWPWRKPKRSLKLLRIIHSRMRGKKTHYMLMGCGTEMFKLALVVDFDFYV